MNEARIDKWMWAVRIFKTRTIAAEACKKGRISINGSLAKAATITLMGLIVVSCGTFALCILEPETDFLRLLFEQVSAYSTAGLSTGITAGLRAGSKAVLIFTMFIGRVGAVTLLSLWVERPEPSAHYTEETITIG